MSGLSILLVDDDRTIRETLAEFFEALGHVVRTAATASEARRAAAEHAPDVTLLDLRLPDADGLTLLHALRADDPELAAIVLTGHADVPTAVRAMQQGALDFLEKPIDLDALQAAVERAAELGRLRREVGVLRARQHEEARHAPPLEDDEVERMIDLAARNADVPVLIVGETGTGKGFVARRIHDRSPQRDEPFIEINCASLAPPFFESELFGHEKGAFTDARQAKRGLLEVAGHGSVFLDEIGELSADAQPRLLKALEERTFRRLGGTTTLRTDARLITATNQPLAQLVESRRFRADLYYRLQVLTITLPPLREAPDRIAPLARALLPDGATITPAALQALGRYAWPGNIRELKNTLWRAALLARSAGHAIAPAHLGLPATADGSAQAPAGVRTLARAERDAIAAALEATGGNRTRAAELLGIARSTLVEKLRRADD